MDWSPVVHAGMQELRKFQNRTSSFKFKKQKISSKEAKNYIRENRSQSYKKLDDYLEFDTGELSNQMSEKTSE